MSKPTPKKNALASPVPAAYHDRMITPRLILVPLLAAATFTACAPASPNVQHRPLQHHRLCRIPRGRLPAETDNPAHRQAGIPVPSFYISEYEVTRRDFADFMRETGHPPSPALAEAGLSAPHLAHPQHPRLPVTGVTLHDARAYCRWLSEKTGATVTLPTLTEWQYAARADLRDAPFAWGWGDPEGRAVWNARCAAPVGTCPPNAWGLFDMSGNVYEWCETAYPSETTNHAFLCGGAWSEKDPAHLRVDHPVPVPPDYCGADTGFRIVMHPPPAGN